MKKGQRRHNWRRITPEKRRQIIKMAAKGATYREIIDAADVSSGAVQIVLVPLGGVHRKEMWQSPSGSRLSLDERVEIRLGLERSESMRSIARRLGRNVSTISREVAPNGGIGDYRPMMAQRRAHRRSRRPKPTKLVSQPELRKRVICDLKKLFSPQQIANTLRTEFPDDETMRISHETIYKSIYVQGRGELRRELAQCLRSGRARRVPQGRIDNRGHLKDMVMISERPADVEDRAVPGHWEGDLILGKGGKSAIGTLVERSSRYVMLFPLPKGRTAEEVRLAMTSLIQTLPTSLRRSLTWDQGREMAEHRRFTLDTGVQVYFCDPHSPWQRGSNENTNGLLRQYFPKGISLRRFTEDDLMAASDSLNERPRETLGWKSPAEVLSEFVAPTG